MGNFYKIKSSPYSTVVFCPKSSSTVSASLKFICGNQHYASYCKNTIYFRKKNEIQYAVILKSASLDPITSPLALHSLFPTLIPWSQDNLTSLEFLNCLVGIWLMPIVGFKLLSCFWLECISMASLNYASRCQRMRILKPFEEYNRSIILAFCLMLTVH